MPIRITDHLQRDLIRVPLASAEKSGVITELVDLLAAKNWTHDRERLLKAVLERESQRTTGVGRGLAIPHAKTDACKKLVVAVGRTAGPIDFQAIDGQPVRLVVLLAGPPDQTGPHIQILARLSRMVTNDAVLKELLEAPTAADLFAVIERQDNA